MRRQLVNSTRLLTAALGACLFWGGVAAGVDIMRPGQPHPGLRDGRLKKALKKDRVHRELTYMAARAALFERVDGDGRKAQGRYTGAPITYLKQPLPNKGVVEHAWPLTRLPDAARSDLHHMFVTIPEARLARVNLHYGEVLVAVWAQGGSRAGASRRVVPVFEVRQAARGDIARAMFYVATMYEVEVPQAEEAILRRWHAEDPVDAEERARNGRVAATQTSRNPFIDHPSLVGRIKDF